MRVGCDEGIWGRGEPICLSCSYRVTSWALQVAKIDAHQPLQTLISLPLQAGGNYLSWQWLSSEVRNVAVQWEMDNPVFRCSRALGSRQSLECPPVLPHHPCTQDLLSASPQRLCVTSSSLGQPGGACKTHLKSQNRHCRD